MWTSRLFWKIFAAYAVLTGLSALCFIALLTSRQTAVLMDQLDRRLHDGAVILREEWREVFTEDPPPGLQAKLRRLGEENNTRLTLVDRDGTVLGDSHEHPGQMGNHRDREEIRQAAARGWGLAERVSPTLGIPMRYYALRVSNAAGETVGFTRLAVKMETVNQSVQGLSRLIWLTAGGFGLAALSLTYLAIGLIIRPLKSMTRAAQSIAEGNFHEKVKIASRDELGSLAAALNSVSRQQGHRIEELQRQGRQLQENSERLETILGAMVEGVIAIDAAERIQFANPSARQLLEPQGKNVVGRPVWEAVRHAGIHEVVRAIFNGPRQQSTELRLPRKNATLSLIATRLPGDPCPGAVLVFHDVTELRRLENLRREFVSNVSHELKTPLTTIRAYTETLLEGAIDDAEHNRRFVERIDEQAQRLHGLILDLLQIARLEAEQAEQDVFDIHAVAVKEAVQLCLEQQQAFAESKGVALTAEFPDEAPDAPLHVMADEEGLLHILDNLVNNALNYTPPGGRVVVRCRASSAGVQIQVEDTGCGIPEEHLPRIFERFYRVDRARSRELGGTGLGLSIVKHLVQVFGGTIEVHSELGKGSVFSVELPS